MAVFPQIYSRIHDACQNAGERLVMAQLRRCLPDECVVWHDIAVGPLQRQPDFVVFHPEKGVLALEVKHWKKKTIVAANPSRVTLAGEQGESAAQHPLAQARECALQIATSFKRDKQLQQTTGAHAGTCAVPYGWGAVMSHMAQDELPMDWQAVFPAHNTLFRADLADDVPPEAFCERLWGLLDKGFPARLDAEQQARVRWHLFPEVRIASLSAAEKAAADAEGPFAIPDLMRVMDLQQEQIARSLGAGHRVIHGAAGSGKTMILLFRAAHLARHNTTGRPILVLCYNRPLAERLQHQLGERGITPQQVQVSTFHAWCHQVIDTCQLPRPKRQAGGDIDFEEMVATVEQAMSRGQVPKACHAAVLIDEAHDFEPAWLRMAAQLPDEAQSLLVMYDDAQAIYQRARKRPVFSRVGIKAQGRTDVMRINYRNTAEILALAMLCAGNLLDEAEETEARPPCIHPASAGRRGPVPQLLRFATGHDEAQGLAERIHALVESGTPAQDIAVLCRDRYQWELLKTALRKRGIATRMRTGLKQKDGFDWQADGVALLTMHAAKGLEFAHVFLMRLNLLPNPKATEEDELRLLYVAMTRATEQLTLSCTDDSPAVQRVQQALARLPAALEGKEVSLQN